MADQQKEVDGIVKNEGDKTDEEKSVVEKVPTNTDEKDMSNEQTQATKPTGQKQTTKPTDPTQTTKPTEQKQTTKPTEQKQTTKPTEQKETTKPTDQTQTAKPTDEQISKWTELFNSLADVTGHITKEELERCWQLDNKNPTEEDINEVLKTVELADKDGDGKINKEEFIALRFEGEKHSFHTADNFNELCEALKEYDTNGDNIICKDELKLILSGYDDDALNGLIELADRNNDGKLDIDELAKFMTENF